jgi:predicted PurR-regulated permease PerM
MSLYTIRQKKNIVLAVTCILGLFILYSLSEVFTAFLGAVVFYTLFKPLFTYFIARHRWPRPLAAILVILLSFLIIILPFSALTLMIFNKIIEFRNHPEQVNVIIQQLNDFASNKLHQPEIVDDIILKAEAYALSTFSSAVNGILSVALKVTVMYFVLYFMLVSFEKFEGILFKYMPFRQQNSLIFAHELRNITYSNVLGQGVISIVQGILLGVGFLIFDLPDAFFWGTICIFLSFLPVVGAGLIFVPAGILCLSHGDLFSGWGILAWGAILVTNIDNVLRFVISRKFADTHPLITIIGVVIGIPYFGILGLVFGPLLLSYFILLVRIYEIRYIKKEQIALSRLKDTFSQSSSE